MWAVARYDLGLADEEFGRLTLAQFGALVERHFEEHRRAMLAAGTVASAVINMLRAADTDSVYAMDFVPDFRPTGKRDRAQSLDEQIAVLSAIFGSGPVN